MHKVESKNFCFLNNLPHTFTNRPCRLPSTQLDPNQADHVNYSGMINYLNMMYLPNSISGQLVGLLNHSNVRNHYYYSKLLNQIHN